MSDEQFLARPMALALEGVTFAYGPTSGALARRADLIARDVSLKVARGEMAGLLGPNGAGKSTLLKLISGALRPQDGRVLVDGRDIRRMSREELARHVAVM
ncbi:MAG TPA: ABC transporter ATP-binding protein, partial [Ktedonobacterales bacterium]|nr:ABC transporter ATP-binding protein [Ktedonobacterales bacterium]